MLSVIYDWKHENEEIRQQLCGSAKTEINSISK